MDSVPNEPPDPGIDISLENGSVNSPSYSTLSAQSDIDNLPSPSNYNETMSVDLVTSTPRKRKPYDNNADELASKKLSKIDTFKNASTKGGLNSYYRPYADTDQGPYIVHVSRVTEDPASPVSLHPVKFGQFLYKNKVQSLKNGGIKRIGRNRVSIEFSTAQGANDFHNYSLLKEKGYKAFIPTFNITRIGIVRGICTELSNEEITEFIETPHGYGKVIKARRLNYKVRSEGTTEWRPSETVVLTFDGQKLPHNTFLFHNSLVVESYKYPVVQCYKCCRYGHVQVQCRSKIRCHKCSEDHPAETCNVAPDAMCCAFCHANHSALDKTCPEYMRQYQIKSLMSAENISFQEASKRLAPIRRPYADVVKQPPSRHHPNLLDQATQDNTHPISYKKTVFLKPRPKTQLQSGYDQKTHSELIHSFTIPTPQNSCALVQKKAHNSTPPDIAISKVIELLDSLLFNLTNITSKTLSLPSNVAEKMNLLNQLLLHINGPDTSMEYEECNAE